MTALELERITTTARADLTELIKEYAREGYKAAHAWKDEGFERLWSEAFDVDSDEAIPHD